MRNVTFFILFLHLLGCAKLTIIDNENTNLLLPPSPYTLYNSEFKQGNYLFVINELKQKESLYIRTPMEELWLTRMGVLYSLVGRYREANSYFDKIDLLRDNLSKDSSLHYTITDYLPTDASYYIDSISESERVIMFNEAHHRPEHRAFVSNQLASLYNKGFHYLAIEALSYMDTNLSKRGYPIIDQSGFYTNEPFFSDMLQRAIKLGYRLIPYEDTCLTKYTNSNNTDPIALANTREESQAMNISNILKTDSLAKIVVYAGYGHIEEEAISGWKPMASYFFDQTGINPLTIDQVEMSEYTDRRLENKFYKNLGLNTKYNKPIILINKNTNATFKNSKSYDVRIFHPRSTEEFGISDWVSRYDRKVIDVTERCKSTPSPFMIKCYFENQAENAVPIEQRVFFDKRTAIKLALPLGTVIIKIFDQNGKTSDTWSLKVE